jgi:hypothetical protein
MNRTENIDQRVIGLDRSWSFINNKAVGNPDQKQILIGLKIKLALLSLMQDYQRAQGIAAGLVDRTKSSPELSKFGSDTLDMLLVRVRIPRFG